MQNVEYKNLTSQQRKALDRAEAAMDNAYVPYSNFSVGACLFGKDKEEEFVEGVNFENAAYGPTICAERSAVAHANAIGARKFDGIAVIARHKDFNTQDVTGPCGLCRQVLYELAQLSGNDLEVILSTTKKDKIVITTITELLPLGFGPKDLGVNLDKYRK